MSGGTDPAGVDEIPVDTDEFEHPDLEVPFDLEAYVESIPEDAAMRGLPIFQMVGDVTPDGIALLESNGIGKLRLNPLREVFAALGEVVRESMGDDVPVRVGLSRLGWQGYRGVLKTLIGRALFQAVGEDVREILRLLPTACDHIFSTAVMEVVGVRQRWALIAYHEMWTLEPGMDFGLFEGLLDFCGLEGSVRYRPDGPAHGELLVEWE